MTQNDHVPHRSASEVIQRFGQARLVHHRNGQHELIGGSRADRIEALEWVSLFAHDIVFIHSHREIDDRRHNLPGMPTLSSAPQPVRIKRLFNGLNQCLSRNFGSNSLPRGHF